MHFISLSIIKLNDSYILHLFAKLVSRNYRSILVPYFYFQLIRYIELIVNY